MPAEIDNEDNESNELEHSPVLKAAPLQPGSRVGLVAPSSRPDSPLSFRRCMQVVAEMGFVPVAGSNVLRNDGFSAGTDEERLDDLQTFIQDPSIEAIACVSGGYGALRLLPLLDFGQIRQHPKIYLGSGDNDSILLAINQLTGLVVFHAPNFEEIEDRHTFNSVKAALCGNSHELTVNCRDADDASFEAAIYSLSDRICEGTICGGNLTALASLYGTRYEPQLKSKILVLDDFNERHGILDRWFTTLYLAGSLTEVAGIAFGAFPGCNARGADNMLPIEDTFGDRLKELATPACFGFKFGRPHKDNVIPIGIPARLDCAAGTLQFLEPALQ